MRKGWGSRQCVFFLLRHPEQSRSSGGARDPARGFSADVSGRRCIRLVDIRPVLSQVMPMRIHGFDQPNLLAVAPRLDFFFAIDCRVGIDEFLVIDQARQVVSAGEAVDQFVLVLEYAMWQVAGNARIENVRARAVGHDVDEEAPVLWHCGRSSLLRHPETRRFHQPREGSGSELISSMCGQVVSVTNERSGISCCG